MEVRPLTTSHRSCACAHVDECADALCVRPNLSGTVDCVILEMFVGDNMHPRLSKRVVTKTMSERKDGLLRRGDAFIALPGGLGTLEELAEIASWRQLELHDKPLVLLNTNSFYTDFW